jgi:transglutaminase-like putative cysteine protease
MAQTFTATDFDGTPTDTDDPAAFMSATWYLDIDEPVVQDFAGLRAGDDGTDTDKAINLFNIIRDDFLYTPYKMSIKREAYKASSTIKRGYGWCVQKSLLMAASCRVIGIPARVGYADVRNHLSTPRLQELMQTDLFTFHGYADLWLDDRWVKVTPVFNKELCEKFGVMTQEFDGTENALFQEFDKTGRRHMEYVADRGAYSDLPFADLMNDFYERYPGVEGMIETDTGTVEDFHKEAEVHRSGG